MLMPNSGFGSTVLKVPDKVGALSLWESLPTSQRIDLRKKK